MPYTCTPIDSLIFIDTASLLGAGTITLLSAAVVPDGTVVEICYTGMAATTNPVTVSTSNGELLYGAAVSYPPVSTYTLNTKGFCISLVSSLSKVGWVVKYKSA